MARIRSVATRLPAHRILQTEIRDAYRAVFGGGVRSSIFDHSGVAVRWFANPLSYYASGRGFAERNRDWLTHGLDLAEAATREALDRAGLAPTDIDEIFFVTTTGLATPSLDALLCHRMGFRSDVLRNPLFGIGCAGGVAALARAGAAVSRDPKSRALVLSVELCSQTFRMEDRSVVNLVGCALFGDGAAAVVVEGDEVAQGFGARIVDTKSELFAKSEGLMGWDFEDTGMSLVLSTEIPGLIRDRAVPMLAQFLADRPVDHWLLHPGGRKVLEAYGRSAAELSLSTEILRSPGNLSSATVLFMLDRLQARPGESALMAAVGPGFALEMCYLTWDSAPARLR